MSSLTSPRWMQEECHENARATDLHHKTWNKKWWKTHTPIIMIIDNHHHHLQSSQETAFRNSQKYRLPFFSWSTFCRISCKASRFSSVHSPAKPVSMASTLAISWQWSKQVSTYWSILYLTSACSLWFLKIYSLCICILRYIHYYVILCVCVCPVIILAIFYSNFCSKGATSTLGHPNGSIAQDWNGWHLRRRGAQRQGVHFLYQMSPKFENPKNWNTAFRSFWQSHQGHIFRSYTLSKTLGGPFVNSNFGAPTLPKMPVEIEPETIETCCPELTKAACRKSRLPLKRPKALLFTCFLVENDSEPRQTVSY